MDFNRKKEKEIGKIRPALVISNNLQNELDIQILMAPISSEKKENLNKEEIELQIFEIPVSSNRETDLDRESKILLHRLRAVRKNDSRLIDYLGVVNSKVLKQVKNTLKIVFEWE